MFTIKKTDGFTLLEVFVAMIAFALGMLALTKLQVVSISTNSFANELSQSATLAENTMERLLALSYADTELSDTDLDGTGQDLNFNGIDDDDENLTADGIALFGLNDTTANTADHSLTGQGINRNYTIYWNIAVNEPNLNNKRIRVIVTYTDNKDLEHRVVLDGIKIDLI